MKDIKNIILIFTILTIGILDAKAKSKVASQQGRTPLLETAVRQELESAQKKSFAILLGEVKNKQSEDVVGTDGRLKPKFTVWLIANAIASNLDIEHVKALLQSGLSYHSKFTGVISDDRRRLLNANNGITSNIGTYRRLKEQLSKEQPITKEQLEEAIKYTKESKEGIRSMIQNKHQNLLIEFLSSIITAAEKKFDNKFTKEQIAQVIDGMKKAIVELVTMTKEQDNFLTNSITMLKQLVVAHEIPLQSVYNFIKASEFVKSTIKKDQDEIKKLLTTPNNNTAIINYFSEISNNLKKIFGGTGDIKSQEQMLNIIEDSLIEIGISEKQIDDAFIIIVTAIKQEEQKS